MTPAVLLAIHVHCRALRAVPHTCLHGEGATRPRALRTSWRTYHQEQPLLEPQGGGSALVMSMHKLTVGDGYAYLTRHVAAGDADLSAGDSLTVYYEQTGNPAGRWLGNGLGALGDGHLPVGSAVTELAMTQVFRDGVRPDRSHAARQALPQHRPRRGPSRGSRLRPDVHRTQVGLRHLGLADESTRPHFPESGTEEDDTSGEPGSATRVAG